MNMIFSPKRRTKEMSDVFSQAIFSKFATEAAEKKEVSEAISCLKNKYDLNTHLVLLCCWMAEQRYDALTPEEITIISNKVSAWSQGVVDGLKVVYSKLSHYAPTAKEEDLIGTVNNDIAMAEKIEQSFILQAAGELEKIKIDQQNKIEIALKNIFNYINSQQVLLHKNDLEKVYRIVKACVSE